MILTRRQALAALPVALAGCATPEPRQSFADIAFPGPLIRLRVGRVERVDAWRAPGSPPNIEHRFQISPARMALGWAEQRLAAAGGPRRAVFTVRIASVTERRLPVAGGLGGLFRTEQSEAYDALLQVELAVLAADGRREAAAEAEVRRTRTIGEDATLNAREAAWHEMVAAMARDLDAEMVRIIDGSFGALRA